MVTTNPAKEIIPTTKTSIISFCLKGERESQVLFFFFFFFCDASFDLNYLNFLFLGVVEIILINNTRKNPPNTDNYVYSISHALLKTLQH